MAQLKVLYIVNSLSWSYFVFIFIYLIISNILLPFYLKLQLLRLKLAS